MSTTPADAAAARAARIPPGTPRTIVSWGVTDLFLDHPVSRLRRWWKRRRQREGPGPPYSDEK
ncbi:MAG: hypothetical protein ACRDH8_10820 [Actinomycetota bacterium]